jgi:UDP-glucose:(heptosyl)LPS alpha-1,3-glucosyltransferase
LGEQDYSSQNFVEQMRIALVTESVDRKTGIGRVVYELARQFVRRNHEVHLVAQTVAVNDHGSRVHQIRAASPWHSVNRFVMRYSVPRLLRELDSQVINSFLIGRGATVVTAQSCHAAGIALRSQYKEIRPRGNRGIFDRVAIHDEKTLFNSPTTRQIIAVSQLVKKQICEYYNVDEAKVAVVPNGVDLQRFEELQRSEKRDAWRRDMNLRDDERVLLFVGNEFARKGLHVVIETIARLRNYPLRLVIVGGDNPVPFLRIAEALGITKKLIFVGSVEVPEQYFALADVFVFPTFYEPFGLVIIEAMAAGVPVITSKHAGAVEGMRHGEEGLFLENPSSVEELSTTLRRLLDDPQLSDMVVRKAFDKVRLFSWDQIAESTLNVYHTTIST